MFALYIIYSVILYFDEQVIEAQKEKSEHSKHKTT